MAEWGLCATVLAPPEQVAAFAAHHLALGAAHLWLHFDDPAQAADAPRHPRITAVACDEGYWQRLMGRRPAKHQQRQSRNVQRVYAETTLPWLGHWDVDEFLWPARPVGQVLDTARDAMVRIAPWEALHDPALACDIFTARAFRAALKGPGRAGLRAQVFGPHASLLPEGVLSHSAGKCLFRTGIAGLEPRLHGAFMGGERVKGPPFAPGLALLHFHAEDRARWLERVPFRVTRGAYQYNPGLAAFLAAATPADLAGFYDRVQAARPDTLAALRQGGALIEADLHLRERVAEVFGQRDTGFA